MMGVVPGILNGGATLIGPTTDGTANQVMETDGAGNLSFVTPAGGGGLADGIAIVKDHEVIQVVDVHMDNHHQVGSSGTGSSTGNGQRRHHLATGTTAGSTGWVKFFDESFINLSATEADSAMNFSKAMEAVFVLSQLNTTANGILRLWFGSDGTPTTNLVEKTMGFEIQGNAIKGAHYGTSEVITDLSTTVTADKTTILRVSNDGAGNLEWFVNGTTKATASTGPTGTLTAGVGLSAGVINGADAAQYFFSLAQIRLAVAQ